MESPFDELTRYEKLKREIKALCSQRADIDKLLVEKELAINSYYQWSEWPITVPIKGSEDEQYQVATHKDDGKFFFLNADWDGAHFYTHKEDGTWVNLNFMVKFWRRVQPDEK
jgi:hypothetical protein